MWKKLLAAVLTLASLYFLGSVLVSQWSEIRSLVDVPALVLFIVLSLPLYVLTALAGAIAWTLAFRSTGEHLPLATGIRVHLVSQIGKYVPGNVGHFVGRLGLLKLKNYSVARGGVSIVLEILWMIGAAAVFSVYALFTGALSVVERANDVADWLPVLVLGLALLVPNLMILVFNHLPEALRRSLGFTGKIRRPPESVVLGCYALYFFNFVLNGLVLIAGFYWLFGAPPSDPILVISLYSTAWLLGFLLPGAPGGIGVREAVFLLLLGGIYGQGIAAAMAIIMRIISSLGDLAAFGLGFLMSRRERIASARR